MTYRKGNKRKQAWMKSYSEKLIAIKPELSGRIDWDTAHFLFFSGKTVDQAVEIASKHASN